MLLDCLFYKVNSTWCWFGQVSIFTVGTCIGFEGRGGGEASLSGADGSGSSVCCSRAGLSRSNALWNQKSRWTHSCISAMFLREALLSCLDF